VKNPGESRVFLYHLKDIQCKQLGTYSMSLVDYFRSSYDIGEFTDIPCVSNDFNGMVGGTLSQFWLSPNGALYIVDYSHTQDMHFEQSEDQYTRPRFVWKPNGNHGQVRFCFFTDYVIIRPEKPYSVAGIPLEARIHFIEGMFQTIEYSNTSGAFYWNG
jgi:hypothetical protein